MFNFFKSNKKGKQNQKSKIKNILIGFLLLVFVFTSFGIFNQKENKNKIVNFIFGIEQVEAEKTVEEIQKEITAIDEKIKETDASNFTEIDKLKAQKKTLTQELAVAEGKGTTDSWKLKEDWKPLSEEMRTALMKAGQLMSTLIHWLSIPAIMIMGYIGELLDNNFIFDGAMKDMLRDIWVLMRDIVNVSFVLILLALAFMNVVKEAWSATWWEIKTMLPKMVFALVAVNFSWAACVFLVDVSNVATTAVLAVPQSLREKHTGDYAETIFTNCTKDPNVNKNTNNEDNGVKFCAPKMLDFLKKNGLADADGKMKNTVTIKEIASAIEGLDEMDFWPFDKNNEADTNAIIYLMAFGLQDIGNLMNNDIGITSLQELTLDSFFGVILMIAYFIVLIALFIVLLMRALMIWLIIAFSPLWALHFVIGDKISFGDKLPIKILHEIFVPVLVAVPLVVGYLMILVGQGVTSGKDGQAIVHNEAVMGGYSLMWKIAAIVILWKGVFAAMDETLAGDVVDKLEKGTERVGKFALKAFRYAPIFPTKVDLDGKDWPDRMAIGDFLQMPSVLWEQVTKLQQKSRERAGKALGIGQTDHAKRMNEFENSSATTANTAMQQLVAKSSELSPSDRNRIVEKLVNLTNLTKGSPEYENITKAMNGTTRDFKKAIYENVIHPDKENRTIFGNGHNTFKQYEEKALNNSGSTGNTNTNQESTPKQLGVQDSQGIIQENVNNARDVISNNEDNAGEQLTEGLLKKLPNVNWGKDVQETFAKEIETLDSSQGKSKWVVNGFKVLSKVDTDGNNPYFNELQKLGELIKTKNNYEVTKLVSEFIGSIKSLTDDPRQTPEVIQARANALIESINAGKTVKETQKRIEKTGEKPEPLT